MADGDVPGVKLGDLIKVGRAHAIEADPMGNTKPETIVTYALKRPMYCGRQYRTQLGDKVVCTRHVELLSSGLPTGRCGQCRDAEMSMLEMRRQESRRLEHAEKSAKRLDGAKRRTDFGGET